MNRKRLEHVATILRDLGLAVLIGGGGDAAVNSGSGRGALDVWGIGCGFVLLMISVWVVGIDARRRAE